MTTLLLNNLSLPHTAASASTAEASSIIAITEGVVGVSKIPF